MNPYAEPKASLDNEALVAIADGIAEGNPTAFVQPGARRRWTLVAATDLYAAWVIAWPAGTGLGMHDHDGSRAVIRVVHGTLRERYKAAASIDTRWLTEGVTVNLSADHVHEVINLGSDEAVTVHVYSPPLSDLSFRIDLDIDPRTDHG